MVAHRLGKLPALTTRTLALPTHPCLHAATYRCYNRPMLAHCQTGAWRHQAAAALHTPSRARPHQPHSALSAGPSTRLASSAVPVAAHRPAVGGAPGALVRRANATSSATSSAVTPTSIDPGALVRNIGVMAHIDAGKTTTTERMLYHAGVMRTVGSVDDGTTQMDFLEEERDRGITIGSAVTTFAWRQHRINLVDTPGHVDFTIEVERSLRVLDGTVAVLDATAGVQAQTLTVWRQAMKHNIPAIGFVNKMDRDGADLERVATSVQDKLGLPPLLLQAPVFTSPGPNEVFSGVVDFINMKLHTWDGTEDGAAVESCDGGYASTPLTHDTHGPLIDVARVGRARLAESLADLDDDFAELMLADGADPETLPADSFLRTIRRLTLANACIPLLCGSARRTKGIQPLMDAVVDFLPSPLERPAITLEGAARRPARSKARGTTHGNDTSAAIRVELNPIRSESLCMLVFKVVFDPHRGPLSFVRVYSGVLRAKATLANSTQNVRERVTKLLIVHADHHTEVEEVEAGNIVAIAGLKHARTGDTLVGPKDVKTKDLRLHGIDFPEPVFSCSIEAESSADADALEEALVCMMREDPSVRVVHDNETGQLLLSGMGELHLDVVISRLRSHYRVECNPGPVRVAYRERPGLPSVSMSHELSRAIGGREQTATVDLTIERVDGLGKPEVELKSLTKGDPEFEFAVREGIIASCSRGVVNGFPIMDAVVTVTNMEFEPETSVGVVAQCAAEATRRALLQADVKILHPVMILEVTVDDKYVGDVLQDLGSERVASVLGVDLLTGTTRIIRTEAALSALLGYDGVLRRLTSGTATFTMEYARHAEMTG
eukprot:m.133803 g.133803  ORF g.133803 m.133803 type:complete len:837 (+) comp11366_c1_seq3:134-2644(+)